MASSGRSEIYTSRGDAQGFAERTRKNLEFIYAVFNEGADVHVVTQLINSLLGLVVFLHERMFIERIAKIELGELVKNGWPTIKIEKGQCGTLGEFVYHLRNAVAHGRIAFSSNSRYISEVTISVEDKRRNESLPYWCATINAGDLRSFCLKLVDLVDQVIG